MKFGRWVSQGLTTCEYKYTIYNRITIKIEKSNCNNNKKLTICINYHIRNVIWSEKLMTIILYTA